MFKCLNCQKSVKDEALNEKIRCPFCGYRVMVKERAKTVVRVQAR